MNKKIKAMIITATAVLSFNCQAIDTIEPFSCDEYANMMDKRLGLLKVLGYKNGDFATIRDLVQGDWVNKGLYNDEDRHKKFLVAQLGVIIPTFVNGEAPIYDREGNALGRVHKDSFKADLKAICDANGPEIQNGMAHAHKKYYADLEKVTKVQL